MRVALTGIPFTSEHFITFISHRFLTALRPHLFHAGIQPENTATMVWNLLGTGPKLPAFWNAFPLHPHDNRQPKAEEVEFGAKVLHDIMHILAPKRVFALGRVAEAAISKHCPHITAAYIRHPANGGHGAFVAGMKHHHII